MKQFLIKVSFFLIGVISITIGLKFTLPIKKDYNSAMVDKLEMLRKNKNKRKIVLIGGSSVGWGLSAKQIEKATKIATINLGHNAGFGLIDYQDYIISCLTPHDIVIFSPEWYFYENPEFYNPGILNNLYRNTRYLQITNKPISTQIKWALTRKNSFRKSNKTDKNNPYRYDCLNENGDVTSHYNLKAKGAKKYTVNLTNVDLNKFKSTFKYLDRSHCVLLFPPTQKMIYKENETTFEKLQISISHSNFNYIDSIKSNIYDEGDFFDNQYHLKGEINKKRTEKVIDYILLNLTFSQSDQPIFWEAKQIISINSPNRLYIS